MAIITNILPVQSVAGRLTPPVAGICAAPLLLLSCISLHVEQSFYAQSLAPGILLYSALLLVAQYAINILPPPEGGSQVKIPCHAPDTYTVRKDVLPPEPCHSLTQSIARAL